MPTTRPLTTADVETSSARQLLRACLLYGIAGSLAACVQTGCGSSGLAGGSGEARLTVLTKKYVAYLNTHQNRPPASEGEFKQYIADAGGSATTRAGVASVDELFVSPRDGKSFVVAYGKAAIPLISRGIIAYETSGKEGKRLVGYRLGYVEAVDDDKFRKSVAQP